MLRLKTCPLKLRTRVMRTPEQTYMLAVVVDDYDMGISPCLSVAMTEIIKGDLYGDNIDLIIIDLNKFGIDGTENH